jgi:hypothetical protein
MYPWKVKTIIFSGLFSPNKTRPNFKWKKSKTMSVKTKSVFLVSPFVLQPVVKLTFGGAVISPLRPGGSHS